MCIVVGFLMCVIVGGVVINVLLLGWLLVCIFLLVMFLVFGKRKYEMLVVVQKGLGMGIWFVLEWYWMVYVDVVLRVLVVVVMLMYMVYIVSEIIVS